MKKTKLETPEPQADVDTIDAAKDIAKTELTPGNPENASPALFDALGAVSPTLPTEGSIMPEGEPVPEKRGRGRPKGTGSKKINKAATESEMVALSVANAEMVVSALDLMRAAVSGGECAANPAVRGAAVAAWADYLEEQGLALPSWVQVSIISVVYIAPAFTTNSGKEKVSGMWGKIKAAYKLWRA